MYRVLSNFRFVWIKQQVEHDIPYSQSASLFTICCTFPLSHNRATRTLDSRNEYSTGGNKLQRYACAATLQNNASTNGNCL